MKESLDRALHKLAHGEPTASVNPYPVMERNEYRAAFAAGYVILYKDLTAEQAVKYGLTGGIAVAAVVGEDELRAKAGLI